MAHHVPTAAELLRDARQRAGLTQRQLAARAGVAQSVVSAYESGRRKPALETLQRLLGATGHRVDIEVVGDATSPVLAGELGHRVRLHRDEIVKIADAYGVRNVRVFGSVARSDENSTSDVDLLVDVGPAAGLFTLMRLERDLTDLLGVGVDVIPSDSLKPDVRVAAEHDVVSL